MYMLDGKIERKNCYNYRSGSLKCCVIRRGWTRLNSATVIPNSFILPLRSAVSTMYCNSPSGRDDYLERGRDRSRGPSVLW